VPESPSASFRRGLACRAGVIDQALHKIRCTIDPVIPAFLFSDALRAVPAERFGRVAREPCRAIILRCRAWHRRGGLQLGFTDPRFPLGGANLTELAVRNTATRLSAARAARLPVVSCYTAYAGGDAPHWKVPTVVTPH
jgi:hypothetical protein